MDDARALCQALRPMKLHVALLSIVTLGTLVQAQAPRVVKVSPSNILSDIADRKKKQPGITSKELAAYANELLEKKGFDYEFDACDLLSARDRKSTTPSFHKRYNVSLTGGQKLRLDFDVLNPEESMCGECWVHIPSRQVTEHEMHLTAEGKSYRVRRTPAFSLDEAQLVDSSLKKVLRKWVVPFQIVPTGISADGTKLYLEHWSQDPADGLVLELSEDGRLAFRERAGLELKEGTWIEDFPKDPNNAYLSYMKFEVGNKTYIIRFTAPCT